MGRIGSSCRKRRPDSAAKTRSHHRSTKRAQMIAAANFSGASWMSIRQFPAGLQHKHNAVEDRLAADRELACAPGEKVVIKDGIYCHSPLRMGCRAIEIPSRTAFAQSSRPVVFAILNQDGRPV